jgi:hypothetical protein
VRRTVPPSAEIEEQIDELLAVGVGENPRESLSGLAKLGARLIIQRAVEDEFDAWLGRACYERRPEYQRGLRNAFRPRRVQTGEGELQVGIPQVREAAGAVAAAGWVRAVRRADPQAYGGGNSTRYLCGRRRFPLSSRTAYLSHSANAELVQPSPESAGARPSGLPPWMTETA